MERVSNAWVKVEATESVARGESASAGLRALRARGVSMGQARWFKAHKAAVKRRSKDQSWIEAVFSPRVDGTADLRRQLAEAHARIVALEVALHAIGAFAAQVVPQAKPAQTPLAMGGEPT